MILNVILVQGTYSILEMEGKLASSTLGFDIFLFSCAVWCGVVWCGVVCYHNDKLRIYVLDPARGHKPFRTISRLLGWCWCGVPSASIFLSAGAGTASVLHIC